MIAPSTPAQRADAVVIGDGIIGLAAARALADRDRRVVVVGRRLPGMASWAAPGLLLPSSADEAGVEVAALHDVAFARYASHLDELRDETGADVALAPRVRVLRGAIETDVRGAFVDPRAIVGALEHAVDESSRIVRIEQLATRVEMMRDFARVSTESGDVIEATHCVVANGAWSGTPAIAGLDVLPVRPMRGQVAALDVALDHAIVGDGWYAVPRYARTLVGSTMEDVGFDAATRADDLERLRSRAAAHATLATARIVDAWAGLRPCTPDLVPLVGFAPDNRSLIYACGHSRNGILLAFETADAVADLVTLGDAGAHWRVAAPARFSQVNPSPEIG